MSSDEDTRVLCKYGVDCYQKNPSHHEKYKHPKKRNRSPENAQSEKKQKGDSEELTDETKEEPKGLTKLVTLNDKKQFIKDKFLVNMPEDFYLFWDFCEELNKQNPKEAFKTIGLTLVGSYDVLEETFSAINEDSDEYLTHWRYYYDPPEFQTVIKGDDRSGFHMGYFRDSPKELPVFVASNEAKKSCVINPMAENIFGAINSFLENLLKTADPFKKMSINNLQKRVTAKAKELQITLSKSTPSMQTRQRKTVCKCFHTAGVVVPYNRKTNVGYRKLPVSEKELRNMLESVTKAYPKIGSKASVELQPVLTAATIANDECDFGTSLELGLNLFCFGSECLNNTILNVVKISYALLDRRAFAEIIDAHLKHRKKGEPPIINCNKK